MKSIKIKGKDYIPVNERLKHFRKEYPQHALISEIIQVTDEHCVFKATIASPDGVVLATGHAHETQSDGYINKTSYIENCESSAWGRALGNFGVGIDTSVASADEVRSAIKKSEAPKKKAVVKKPAAKKAAPKKEAKPKMTAPIFQNMLKGII